jgi:hypothetical protein
MQTEIEFLMYLFLAIAIFILSVFISNKLRTSFYFQGQKYYKEDFLEEIRGLSSIGHIYEWFSRDRSQFIEAIYNTNDPVELELIAIKYSNVFYRAINLPRGINFKYKEVEYFKDGYAIVRIGSRYKNYESTKEACYGAIDEKGNEVLTPKYTEREVENILKSKYYANRN